MKTLILYLMNKSPFFSVSCDEYFGDMHSGSPVRFSMARIPLGLRKIYLFTYCSRRFQLYKHLHIEELRPWPDPNDVENKVQNYRKLNLDADENSIGHHVQYLERKLSMDNSTLSLFHAKISIYCAILLLFIGYFFNLVQKIINEFSWNIQFYIISILSIFCASCLLNFFIFIFEYSKNKEVSRSKFSDIKSDTDIRKISEACYFDWFNTKEEVQILSAYIKNAEKYLYLSTVLILITSSLFFLFSSQNFNNITINNNDTSSRSFSFFNKNNVFNKSKISELPALFDRMTTQNVKKIYVIKTENITNDPIYKNIRHSIELFSNGIDVIDIAVTDTDKTEKVLILKPSQK